MPLIAAACSARKSVNTTVVASGAKKIDISKQGLNSIENETVKLNLMGKSKTMESKGWVDPQGRKGKVRAACRRSSARAAAAFPRLEESQTLCLPAHVNGLHAAHGGTVTETGATRLGLMAGMAAGWRGRTRLHAHSGLASHRIWFCRACRATACTALPTSMAPMWTATAQSTPPTPGLSLVSALHRASIILAARSAHAAATAGSSRSQPQPHRPHSASSTCGLKQARSARMLASIPPEACPVPRACPVRAGDSYKLGTKGLLAWAGLIVVLLGVGVNLVVSTSAIGQ